MFRPEVEGFRRIWRNRFHSHPRKPSHLHPQAKRVTRTPPNTVTYTRSNTLLLLFTTLQARHSHPQSTTSRRPTRCHMHTVQAYGATYNSSGASLAPDIRDINAAHAAQHVRGPGLWVCCDISTCCGGSCWGAMCCAWQMRRLLLVRVLMQVGVFRTLQQVLLLMVVRLMVTSESVG